MRNINEPLRTDVRHFEAVGFAEQLLSWYERNKRDLPWRETRDPFIIWLSEIILQQTRVSQGLPYYLKFVDAFASIQDFAQADLDEVLKLWQGLGYYSRARNMHQCAINIVEQWEGKFPDNYIELQKLKGVGKYTAAAIASICFDEAIPTVDGNVFRLLSRLFGITDDIAKASTFKVFFDLGSQLISKDKPGDFNQAMMEFGATVCTPKSPDCDHCVFQAQCFAYQKNMISELPVKSRNIKIKHRYFNYHVFLHKEEVLVRQRSESDIWAGLYEFDLIEVEKSLKSSNFDFAQLQYSSSEIQHQLTHQKLHIKFHVHQVNSGSDKMQLMNERKLKSVSISELKELAVPKPIELFLKKEFCL